MATIRQEGAPRRAGLGRLDVVALDGPDLDLLAGFYSELTGWPIVRKDEDWYQLGRPDTGGATLAFQLAPDHRPPVWPSADRPQQLHLDFVVDDLDEGERHVLAIGGRKAETQPGEGFRVFLDPAGHPFCLVTES
jgi:catechol 2,3-dioxygenase-like lactoylglutathione lyase family enzyme